MVSVWDLVVQAIRWFWCVGLGYGLMASIWNKSQPKSLGNECVVGERPWPGGTNTRSLLRVKNSQSSE